MALTTVNPALLDTQAQYTGFKNRIINGDMRIDQRNSGASVTNTTAYLFGPDRWKFVGSVVSKFTVQQNAGSITPPTGFINYFGCTSLSAYTVGAAEQFIFNQPIEGLNVTDLAWGTANAATVTLSFWVRSSLTGTFGGALVNSAGNRSYPFVYTISTANTWEQKSITVAGDTSGTWLTTNGIGIFVQLSLGAGSTLSTTGGAWASGYYASATGAVSVVGTSGATFYITGVQLEKGTAATLFDVIDYGRQLQQCQRYYETYTGGFYIPLVNSNGTTSTGFKVTKRVTPTVTVTSGAPSAITPSLDAVSFAIYGNTLVQIGGWIAVAEL